MRLVSYALFHTTIISLFHVPNYGKVCQLYSGIEKFLRAEA